MKKSLFPLSALTFNGGFTKYSILETTRKRFVKYLWAREQCLRTTILGIVNLIPTADCTIYFAKKHQRDRIYSFIYKCSAQWCSLEWSEISGLDMQLFFFNNMSYEHLDSNFVWS